MRPLILRTRRRVGRFFRLLYYFVTLDQRFMDPDGDGQRYREELAESMRKLVERSQKGGHS